jgi:hypothetical protein
LRKFTYSFWELDFFIVMQQILLIYIMAQLTKKSEEIYAKLVLWDWSKISFCKLQFAHALAKLHFDYGAKLGPIQTAFFKAGTSKKLRQLQNSKKALTLSVCKEHMVLFSLNWEDYSNTSIICDSILITCQKTPSIFNYH